MKVGEIAPREMYLPIVQQRAERIDEQIAGREKVSFGETLSEFVGNVNDLQKVSGERTEQFIKGEPVDIHDVMIAAEEAKTSFALLMELRNKALDMYREVIRIQV